MAVTSIAGHFCRKEFEALSPLPVVDIIDEVGRAVTARLVRRIGILGTRTVMESRFYGGVTTATVLLPVGTDLEDVHDAYDTMSTAGAVTDVQRTIFYSAARRLIEEEGAEAIMLGGTDLALVFEEKSSPYPLIDCAEMHVDAIAH